MKKGFTLVELLAVIVVLGVILAIAIPNAINIIEKARIDAIIRNEEVLVRETKKHLVANTNLLPVNIGDTIEITLDSLKTNRLIDSIKNPRNNQECNGYVLITKIGNNEYDYSPQLNCVDISRGSTLSDGLLRYWKLDNGQALDYSLNNSNGIVYGALPSQDRLGKINLALSFNGSSNYVQMNSASGITNAFTVSAWFKRNGPSGGTLNEYHGIISNISGDAIYTRILISSSGSTVALQQRDSVGNIVTSFWHGQPWNDNNWHQVAYVFNGSFIKLYTNGKMQGAPQPSSGVRIGSSPPLIGYGQGGSYITNGVIDDIRIYSRELSESEIMQLYDLDKIR